jgi:hypothetical protein
VVFAFNTMPMDKKLQQELKFRIGEQYGKYEFELDWVTSVIDNKLRYELYRYIINERINLGVKFIMLYLSEDRLIKG